MWIPGVNIEGLAHRSIFLFQMPKNSHLLGLVGTIVYFVSQWMDTYMPTQVQLTSKPSFTSSAVIFQLPLLLECAFFLWCRKDTCADFDNDSNANNDESTSNSLISPSDNEY
mmetsp:Transcript_42880/g.77102  ORF Transcript_42880/g.77102 Transcript_42880/m.77102 type:complete len:112 (+) Transcript_42880:83-418(+)